MENDKIKKATAIFMSTLLSAMLLASCSGAGTGSGTGSAKTNSDYKGQTIFGEVTKVSDDSITIEVGTMDKKEENAEQSQESGEQDSTNKDSSADSTADDSTDKETTGTTTAESNKKMPEGEKPGQITKTGETATITVDDDTEITENQMGGPGMGGNGAPDQSNGGSQDSNQQGQPPSGQPPQGAPDQNGNTDSNGNSGSQGSNQQNQPPSGQPPQGAPDQNNSDSSDNSGSQDSNQQGQPPSGQPPQGAPDQNGEEIKLTDIDEGDTVSITINEDGETESIKVMSGEQNQGGQNGGNASVEYTAVKTYDSDTEVDGETVESTGDDENGILVKDGNVDLDDMTVTRTSDSSTGGDNASFYGVSAAVLGTGGESFVSDSKIATDAEGGAGIFAYGDGTVYASDTTIKTSKNASGGIHAAGGGTLYAWDLDVTTAGGQSAAIRSDRGGGKMVVDGGTYTSTGAGSPAIYSTADITVNDATLTAKGSEAVCIEGKNQIRLFDSKLTGNMSDDDQNDCTWNVILYQSMSGDSEEGTSEFEMDGGELTAKNGGMFYTTNTSSKFVLKDVDITYAEENDFFLKATGNSNARGWGQSGSNGVDCDFTAISQDMEGDVIWDKISKLDFYMTDGSSLTGAIIKDNSNAGDGKGGYCKVYIDKDSTWTVTGDSTLTTLSNAGTIKDKSGNTVTIKGTDGTVYVKGTSDYTITVKNYSTDDKTDKASTISSWSDFETEKPSQL